jgi:hypothetical protein
VARDKERKECIGKQGEICDFGFGRLQQLGKGDFETRRKEVQYELKDMDVEDCITGGATVKLEGKSEIGEIKKRGRPAIQKIRSRKKQQ